MQFNPKIIFEDDFIIAIDKPAGIVVNSADSVGENETVEEWIRDKFEIRNSPARQRFAAGNSGRKFEKGKSIFADRAGIIHRLDKDTSGILLLAKNEAVFDQMQAKFKNREVKKRYLALIHGSLDKEGNINENIGRVKEKGKFAVDPSGKPSLTDYKLVDKYTFNVRALNDFEKNNYERLKKKYDVDNFSLLEVEIHTGRTHQIRVHFAFLKHPVAGDTLYGFHKMVKFEKLWCPRQFLHAAKLSFIHPVMEKEINLKSQLPKDLCHVLEKNLVQV